MISRLRGRPVARRPDGLVLDVNGVGYLARGHAQRASGSRTATARSRSRRTCTCARTRSSSTGSPSAAERELFEHLLSVSGVGPKVALAIVSGSTPAELRRAIVLEDTARFEAIPGIGKKTAQRVVLELKEKVGTVEQATCGGAAPHLVARDALVELGYSLADAERASPRVDPDLPPEERVRLALRRAA